jgi:uncharacterized protein
MKRIFSPFSFLILAIVSLSGPAANAASKCCVWRITNTKAAVYLVGSVHALNAKDYPLPEPYEVALRDSQRLVFEFDPKQDDEFSRKFDDAAKYPKGQDIRTKVHAKLLAWLRQNTDAIHWNYDKKDKKYHATVAKFDTSLQYRPWYIAQHYFDLRGYSDVTGKYGVDNYLFREAKKMGKQTGGLESVDEHIQILSGLSDLDSELLLLDQIVHGYQDELNFDKTRSAWRHGNTDKLWASDARLRKETPWIAARLADNRNVRWIPRIEREIKTGKPTAIVAGALHFSGPNSVVTLLQHRGYTIEQL